MGALHQPPVRAILLAVGVLCIAAAALWPLVSRWSSRLGHLPGDIVVRRANFTFAFPIVTCLLLSLLLSALFTLFRR